MRRTLILLATVTALAAALLFSKAAAQGETAEPEKPYIGKNIADREAKQKLKDKDIVIKDIYAQKLTSLKGLKGYSLRKYAAFTTQDGFGSGMICLVDRRKEKSLARLDEILPGGKILLYGQIKRTGYRYVFIVEKLYRGHSVQKTVGIKLTISGPGEKGKKTYRLEKAGQTYRVPDPNDGTKFIHVSFRQ